MAVIAMTREMGTGGKDVTDALAQRLGLTVVHHELVELGVAARTGLRESEVHRFLEGEATLLERWKIGSRRLSRSTALEILEIANQGNVLIRGWGAPYLLREVPHVVCVRVCAPMPFREATLMQRLGTRDVAVVRREIERNDAAHNGTMQKLFGIDWTDASLYAVTLNRARLSVADCVECIVRLTESADFAETPKSRAALEDQILGARINTAIEQRFGNDPGKLGIDLVVASGVVTLSGASSDERFIVEVIRLIQDVKGVKSVQSRIAHLGFQGPG